MTSRDFCFWLQGHFELTNPTTLDQRETELVKRHLNMVFLHEIDPSMPDPDGRLDAAHQGKPTEPPPSSSPWHGPGGPTVRC